MDAALGGDDPSSSTTTSSSQKQWSTRGTTTAHFMTTTTRPSNTRTSTSSYASRAGDEMLDQSINLGDDVAFGFAGNEDDTDLHTVRSGRTRAHAGAGTTTAQHHRSLVDIFLADDNKDQENDVIGMERTGKGKKCRNVCMWLGVLVVIGIVFVTVPKGGMGFGSGNSSNSKNSDNSDSATAAVTPDNSDPVDTIATSEEGSEVIEGQATVPEELVKEHEHNSSSTSSSNQQSSTTATTTTNLNINEQSERMQNMYHYVMDQQHISNDDSFRDTGMPAYMALKWISDNDPAQLHIPDMSSDNNDMTEHNQTLLVQRYSLGVLFYHVYNYTNEENEGRRRRHLAELPDSIRQSATQDELDRRFQFNHWTIVDDTCQWFGIECNEHGLVTSINISHSLLEATPNGHRQLALPPELFQAATFPELTKLDVSHNRLGGFSPNAVHLPKLEEIHLEHNRMQGMIEPFLKVSTLKTLSLGTNIFSVNLPEVQHMENSPWSTMTHLEILQIDNNNLQGPLPGASWGTFLTNLKILEVDGNNLSGEIPQEWSSLQKLEVLKIAHNRNIEGTLPDFITTFTNLKHLSVQDTNLNGLLPTNLANLQALEELHLQQTYLRGTIPDEICDLIDTNQLRVLNSDCLDNDPKTDPRIICDCCTRCFPHHSR